MRLDAACSAAACKRSNFRRHDEGVEISVARNVDLRGTEASKSFDGLVSTGSNNHGRGLTDLAGQRQQLVGDLLDVTAVMLDENEDL